MIKGKNAVVTGSTSGIGLGIARALAQAGCNVMLTGLGQAAEIERLRTSLAAETGVMVRHDGADLSDRDAVAGMIARAQGALGSVDILANNVGAQYPCPIEDYPLDRYDLMIALNMSAAFHATRAALPQMKARGWGRIINTASAHGLVASVHKGPYIMAKHGIVGLTKTTALEAATFGITCNAICPGWVHTPLVQSQIDARAQQRRISQDRAIAELVGEKQPNGRMVTVEEIGALAVFLAGDLARSITGVAIPIDGGWTAQ